MFKNKLQEAIFTLFTSGIMIYIMGVYNIAVHNGGLEYGTFIYAAHSFLLEWAVGFICAFFIASRTSKYFAFKVAKEDDRAILKILCIQTFTVCTIVPLMSALGTIEASGITMNFPIIWIQTIFINFIMAFPLQILIVGPFCRWAYKNIMMIANK